jgi:ABC-type multidrug transport system ATPase subunit
MRFFFKYSEKIGYCPQEDCLNYYLTGRELLYVIANIKGYSNEGADKIIEALLNRFDLTKYADKPCLEYSGGNKRKLHWCLAFLGSPSVILPRPKPDAGKCGVREGPSSRDRATRPSPSAV